MINGIYLTLSSGVDQDTYWKVNNYRKVHKTRESRGQPFPSSWPQDSIVKTSMEYNQQKDPEGRVVVMFPIEYVSLMFAFCSLYIWKGAFMSRGGGRCGPALTVFKSLILQRGGGRGSNCGESVRVILRKQLNADHNRLAGETPFSWRFAGWPFMTQHWMLVGR